MIHYKAVIIPAPDQEVGDERRVELVRMELTFAIGSQNGQAPEDIVRGSTPTASGIRAILPDPPT